MESCGDERVSDNDGADGNAASEVGWLEAAPVEVEWLEADWLEGEPLEVEWLASEGLDVSSGASVET